MSNYLNYTDQELLEILGKYNSLTFLARIELKKELLNRGIVDGSRDFEELKRLIEEEMTEIKTLKFLSDIGFKVSWFNNNESYEVTRSSTAILMDLILILLGIVFSMIGIFGLSRIISYVSPDIIFGIGDFIFNTLLLGIGFFGFRIFYNGTDRLIKYKDFKLVVDQGNIILIKRFDFKLEEIQKEVSSLNLKSYNNQISLMSESVEIINTTSPSFRAKMTLEEMVNHSKSRF